MTCSFRRNRFSALSRLGLSGRRPAAKMKRQRGNHERGRDAEAEEVALPIPRHRLSQESNAKHYHHHLGELVLELVMFFSVLGGLRVFGVLGIVLGPVLFAVAAGILDVLSDDTAPSGAANNQSVDARS
jgi:hypothetical protein